MPKKDAGLTPIGAGTLGYGGEGYSIREIPERYAGKPPASEQLSGVSGPDLSGATAPVGSPKSSPAPRRSELIVTPPDLDPGPPEPVGVTPATDEIGVWQDPTELGPTHEMSQVDPMYRVRASTPPVEGNAEEVPYGEDPDADDQIPSSAAPAPAVTPSAAPASVASPISSTHIGDSRPRFGPGAPSAFSGGMGPANPDPTPVVAPRARTMGPGADPHAVFSSTPKQFDHTLGMRR